MAEQKHVFISYVREDSEAVDRLCKDLTAVGVKVWLDRNDITPGVRWRQAIRRAIQDGAFFIACFSKEYNERSTTYMNEELTLAIDELRQRSSDRAWFIPVKLNEGKIPDRDIGAGETLQSLQRVELNDENWSSEIKRILAVVQPTAAEVQRLMETLEEGILEIPYKVLYDVAEAYLGSHRLSAKWCEVFVHVAPILEYNTSEDEIIERLIDFIEEKGEVGKELHYPDSASVKEFDSGVLFRMRNKLSELGLIEYKKVGENIHWSLTGTGKAVGMKLE